MPVQGAREFNATVRKLGKLLPEETMREAIVSIGFDVLTGFVESTPVDTGRHRANWQVSIGSPKSDQIDGATPVATALEAGFAILRTAPPFGTIHFTNNAEAIEVLELGLFQPPNPGPSRSRKKGRKGKILVRGGFSVQAPRGMMRVTIERMNLRLASSLEQIQARVERRF